MDSQHAKEKTSINSSNSISKNELENEVILGKITSNGAQVNQTTDADNAIFESVRL